MDLKHSTSDVEHAQFTAPYALQRWLKWVCSGVCVCLVASWCGWAGAQSKLPSSSGMICYGDYGSLASTLSEYCKEDESCSGVKKPPLDYFLKAERDLGKSTYLEIPGAVVVAAIGGPKWVIGVLRRRGMSESELSSLSKVMESVCEKGDVSSKAVAGMEFYSLDGKAIGKCDAFIACK
jgi:hypothetical protein